MRLNRTGLALVVALLAAACSDDLVQPRVATNVSVNAGDRQIAQAGESVVAHPSVLVRDQNGRALAGVSVRFDVIDGGGSVEVSSVQTGANGVASAGRWVLGPVPGANALEATVESLPGIRFTATATSPFTITVRYVGEPSAVQRQAVDSAVSRWRSVIIRDLTDIPMNVPSGSCFPNQPALSETIDDVVIYVEFTTIDGVGSVLGQAGPCYIRNENDLPIIGYLKLDVADLVRMETIGALADLVLHEIGHVLGIGSLWSTRQLLTGAGTSDPQFRGANALAAYRQLGGELQGIPVENSGSSGTRDSHWRETVFRSELMTGYLSGVPNPMSAMTVASLQDLGYTTNASAASLYILGSSSAVRASPMIELGGSEIVSAPRYRVDRTGVRRPMSF